MNPIMLAGGLSLFVGGFATIGIGVSRPGHIIKICPEGEFGRCHHGLCASGQFPCNCKKITAEEAKEIEGRPKTMLLIGLGILAMGTLTLETYRKKYMPWSQKRKGGQT